MTISNPFRGNWKALLLHASLVFIVVGAITTHYLGEEAMLSLRVGETKTTAVAEDNTLLQLPFAVTLNKFSVKTYPDGKTHLNYISRISIDGGEEVKVAMNHPHSVQGYSLLQMYYDSDMQGTTLLVQHDPWGIGITFCGYYLLLASCVIILLSHLRVMYKARAKGFWISMAIAFAGAMGYVVKKLCFSDAPLMPVLRSPYLVVHVSVIIMAYMLMICMLFTKAVTGRKLLKPAVMFLMMGIFIGAIWANESWGRYWSWDPKETWALITLLIYSLPLHHRSLPIFRRDRLFRIYIILAIISVLITYFGVNYFMGGMHSYA